jgi:hypothetical protein
LTVIISLLTEHVVIIYGFHLSVKRKSIRLNITLTAIGDGSREGELLMKTTNITYVTLETENGSIRIELLDAGKNRTDNHVVKAKGVNMA